MIKQIARGTHCYTHGNPLWYQGHKWLYTPVLMNSKSKDLCGKIRFDDGQTNVRQKRRMCMVQGNNSEIGNVNSHVSF